ncbi:uncharacterized methyltransferase C3H7.11-like isoform X2 [Rhodamnia argentea]|uniref:Uncharacterized methyltransferase C3H7.11-like isoform X2 n=1 Tax=Rhodamnia argentea TaxID=178133 RepID=A0ABM3H079_9MYRT|nr:uncharacterized methyltransferase C3H7.11-like isoform X2 [Rhodamnia argentea]
MRCAVLSLFSKIYNAPHSSVPPSPSAVATTAHTRQPSGLPFTSPTMPSSTGTTSTGVTKTRHYLEKDWGQYFSGDIGSSNGKKVVLEVGCGAGNTIFPLLASFPDLYIHACDLSPHAIKLLKSHADYKETQVSAFVCDVTEEDLCDRLGPSSVDIVTLIFMLSAVLPSEMPKILQNIGGVLKPDGCVLLRDYAFGDFAQVKLKEKDRMITENFYVRGDGTCSYYFTEDFLSNLFLGAGFLTADMSIYKKQIENRSRSVTMDRYWIRGTFTKQNCGLPDSVLASK